MTDIMTEPDKTARFVLPLMGLASVALFHLTALIPPVGLLAAAPLYYLFAAHSASAGMMALAGGGVVTLVTNGPMVAYLYMVMAGGVAWFLAEGFLKGRPVSATVLRASGFPWGMFGLALFGVAMAAGESVSTLLTGWVKMAITATIETYQTNNVDPDQLARLIQQQDELVTFMVDFFPSILFLAFFAAAVATVMVIRAFSVRYRLGIHFPVSFATFRAPDELVWGVIVGGFGGYLVEGTVGTLAWNVMVIAFAVFILQGVALLHHTFVRFNTPILLRAFGYFLLFSQPALLGMAGCFGIADIWADFRKTPERDDDDDSSQPRS